MIFDTDIIIWVQHGSRKAAELIDATQPRCISILSYMELLRKAKSKEQHTIVKSYVQDLDFIVVPLSENIGHRALIYIEEYSLSHGISADDALIAATAVENNLTLISSNAKHYRSIKDLNFKKFIP